MSTAEEKVVFISHASSDAKKARALCEALEAKGFGCWIAPRDIDPGGQYGEEIIRGIECTKGLVLMLSEKSNASPHVRDEAERAKHYGKRIIPLRIEDIIPSRSLEFYIATSQWIDAYGGKWTEGLDLLSSYIAKMEGMPAPPTLEPETSPIRKKSTALIAVACFVLAAATIGGWMLMQRDTGTTTAQEAPPRSPIERPTEEPADPAGDLPGDLPGDLQGDLQGDLPGDSGPPDVKVATAPTQPRPLLATQTVATATTAPVVTLPPEVAVPANIVASVDPVPAATLPIDTALPESVRVAPPDDQKIKPSPPMNRILLSVPDTGPHPNVSRLVPRYHALVIGINEYAHHGPQGWDNLRTAVNDAKVVASTLNEQYGFSVTLLLDAAATRSGIMQELDTIATAYPDEAILIYYAGHGFYKEDLDQGYWIPSDARRRTDDGRPAKQDWVWNSTIQEMLNSTKSKHVLMIADSCFSGALFRGAEADEWFERERPWYRRAIKKKSRYLITSGGLEPVVDGGGGGHSLFARKVIDYLHHTAGGVFSASDMAHSVREEVSAQTGQRVRMGHLPVKSHEGGEFVFLRGQEDLPPEAEFPDTDNQPIVAVADIQKQVQRRAPAESQRAAVEMFAAGATNAALEVLTSFGDDPFVKSLVESLHQQARQNRLDGIQDLLTKLDKRIADEITVMAAENDDGTTLGDIIADDLWDDDSEDTPAPAESP